jgi:hypothetical protein
MLDFDPNLHINIVVAQPWTRGVQDSSDKAAKKEGENAKGVLRVPCRASVDDGDYFEYSSGALLPAQRPTWWSMFEAYSLPHTGNTILQPKRQHWYDDRSTGRTCRARCH